MSALRVVAFAFAVSVVAVALAQDTTGGWGLGSPYNRRYDPASEVTFSGRVVGVQRMPPIKGMSPAILVLVRTASGGTAMVELGPAWYVDNQPFKVGLKDRLVVTGSKVFEAGRSSILARKVVRNNKVAYLRGVDGFPMWVASRGHVDVMAAGVTVSNFFEGRIVTLLDVSPSDGSLPNRQVMLNTPDGLVAVDVGPVWFIERQNFSFRAGDTLSVIALRIQRRQRPLAPLAVAAQVRRGDRVLVLRTESGRSAWDSWGGG